MIKVILNNILRFIFLVLLQVLILDGINLGGYINPYMYILFIILLPFETPNWLLLVLAFMIGISVDAFSNTLGIHASASVFAAFLRPMTLKFMAPRDGYEAGTQPKLSTYGFGWFLRYSLIIIFSHHLFFFIVIAFDFADFFSTLMRAILSGSFTLVIIIISQYITYRK